MLKEPRDEARGEDTPNFGCTKQSKTREGFDKEGLEQ